MIDLAQSVLMSVLMLQMTQSRQFDCIQEGEENKLTNVFICLDNAEKNKGIS